MSTNQKDYIVLETNSITYECQQLCNCFGIHDYKFIGKLNKVFFNFQNYFRGDGRYEKLVGLLYLTNQRAKELVVLFRVSLY